MSNANASQFINSISQSNIALANAIKCYVNIHLTECSAESLNNWSNFIKSYWKSGEWQEQFQSITELRKKKKKKLRPANISIHIFNRTRKTQRTLIYLDLPHKKIKNHDGYICTIGICHKHAVYRYRLDVAK